MERFTVNGTEVEFDPFDLDVMEGYMAGLERVDAERRVTRDGEGPTDTLRRACYAILDFFDDQLGDGKSKELFGQRINAKTIFDGYQEFTTQVNACIGDYAKTLHTERTAPVTPLNREQRRRDRRKNS